MKANARPPMGTPADQAGVLKFNSIQNIRAKRISEEISATLLARTADIERTRMSFLECGHVRPTEEELGRLGAALDQLIAARHKVRKLAAEVGWPAGAPVGAAS